MPTKTSCLWAKKTRVKKTCAKSKCKARMERWSNLSKFLPYARPIHLWREPWTCSMRQINTANFSHVLIQSSEILSTASSRLYNKIYQFCRFIQTQATWNESVEYDWSVYNHLRHPCQVSVPGFICNVCAMLVLLRHQQFRNSFGQLAALHSAADACVLLAFWAWAAPLTVM